MKNPPSDQVEVLGQKLDRLAPRDRRRLVIMRQDAGAVDIRITVHARPSGRDASWRPIQSGTRKYTAHSAFNAEQLILGGPLAGTTFAAPRSLLEFYEQLELNQRSDTKE
jgi:hypothetical protein